MTVDEAVFFFQNHFHIALKLGFLKNVGLGYVSLGQPAPTFSGGEAQRIKLADELSRKDTGKTVYILDEPTTGLDGNESRLVMEVLKRLQRKGRTIVIITHNPEIATHCADRVISMDKGRIVSDTANGRV